MKEPKKISTIILLSIPFMLLNVIIALGIFNVCSTFSLQTFGLNSNVIILKPDVAFLFLSVLLVVIHEFIHLLFVPNVFRSNKTMIGLTLLVGYVYTEEEIQKARYILITIAPFVILSVILPIILGVFGLLTSNCKLFILLNAMGSSVDILSFLLIFAQVPKHAVLRNNGTTTYWKVEKV